MGVFLFFLLFHFFIFQNFDGQLACASGVGSRHTVNGEDVKTSRDFVFIVFFKLDFFIFSRLFFCASVMFTGALKISYAYCCCLVRACTYIRTASSTCV